MDMDRRLIGIISTAGAIVLAIIIAFSATGKNNNGYRTVVQYPTGYTFVQLEPDWYFTWFGSETVYNDVITFDFTEGKNPANPTVDKDRINVQYQDGGYGSVGGIARFDLPDTEVDMLKIHKEFLTNNGLANKLLVNVTEEAMNLTAGLMASEDAYAVQRSDFSQWSRDQVESGKFKTKLREISDVDAVGKKIVRKIPVIAYDDETGHPLQESADIQSYNINVSGFQIVSWDFEPKTLEQITEKREATMAIITAKANADRAQQDTITAAEMGKASVMKAKYVEEVIKVQAVVVADREKEVAVIGAQRQVEVAGQQRLEAEQKKLAAVEYKQEQILRGEGDARYKELVLEADGDLSQKLATYERVEAKYAENMGKQKWVPDFQMGSGGSEDSSAATDLISLLKANAARELSLDMSMATKK